MEAALPALESWEKGKPLPRVFGYELPWWLALLVFGDSAPMEERKLQETKQEWNETEPDNRGALVDALRLRFNELDSSTVSNFVRLTIVAGVIAGLMGFSQVMGPVLLNTKSPGPSLVVAWLYMFFMLVAVGCVLVMVAPKLKEFREFSTEARDDVGLQVLRNHRENGWPEYVRLMHRYAHRIQLITFERRVKHVGCWAAWLSLACCGLTLHLARVLA